jgi:hypothetical protein
MRRVIALLLASCCCSPLLARDVVQVSAAFPALCFMRIAWKNARRG